MSPLRIAAVAAVLWLCAIVATVPNTEAGFSASIDNPGNAFASEVVFRDDGDGVPPAADVCPAAFDPDQYDTDGDGIGDACDPTPTAPTAATFVVSGQALDTADSFDLVLADLDGDDDLDVAYANKTANTVWRNNGTGTFTNSGQSLGSSESNGVIAADLDGDGDRDLVFANKTVDTVWFNNGAGLFANSGQSLSSAETLGVAVGDVDADGDLDLVAASTNTSSLWLNNGIGVFTNSGQTLSTAENTDAAFGDLDDDGDLDIVFAHRSGAAVWRNNGSGTFTATAQTFGTDDNRSVSVTDLDGDGDLDVVVANKNQSRVWRNTGTGSFIGGQLIDAGENLDISVGDLDGDGDRDLAMGAKAADSIWLSNGAATFVDSGQGLGTTASFGVATGDVDGDGDLDLLNASDATNRLWFNTGTAPVTSPDVGPVASRTSSGPLTVMYPSTVATGDLLLLVQVNLADQNISTPSGWSLLADARTSIPEQFRFTVWWRAAPAAGTSVALDVFTNSRGASAWVSRYATAGQPPTTATATVVNATAGPSAQLTPTPNLTTNAADATVISLVAARGDNPLSLATPQGFTTRFSTTTTAPGDPVAFGVADRPGLPNSSTVMSPTWRQDNPPTQWVYATVAFTR